MMIEVVWIEAEDLTMDCLIFPLLTQNHWHGAGNLFWRLAALCYLLLHLREE